MNPNVHTSKAGPYRRVTEVPASGEVPWAFNPDWADRFPGLFQGITRRGDGNTFDMGMFGGAPIGQVHGRWDRLARESAFSRLVHGRQIHGRVVRTHRSMPAGRLVVPDCDGHVTAEPDTLLTVATADCVPISITTEEGSAVALLHAGWRGSAAGILEAGLAALVDASGARVDGLHVHMGPAICGVCYEVGPEVHRALSRPEPAAPTPIDLRGVLADRAAAAGVRTERITISTLCTRCGEGGLFSHRRGDSGRQMAFLGIRSDD